MILDKRSFNYGDIFLLITYNPDLILLYSELVLSSSKGSLAITDVYRTIPKDHTSVSYGS